jgi:hypothetical protein
MSDETEKDGKTTTVPEKRHTITFYVNNAPVETRERRLTGLQIKQFAGVPVDYELFLVRGSESVPIPDDEVVTIHENAHFRAIPIGNFG